MPDKMLLEKGNFTEYFTQLHEIINDNATSTFEKEEKTLSETSINDLKIEVSRFHSYLLSEYHPINYFLNSLKFPLLK